MPFYESVFIARQDLSAQAVEALADQFSELIKTNGGSVEKREYWGLRSLAYRIKKNRKGHYVLFGIDANVEAIREFERKMGLDENLLRHLTIRVDSIDPEPSPMANNDRDDERKPYNRTSHSENRRPEQSRPEQSRENGQSPLRRETPPPQEAAGQETTKTDSGASDAHDSPESPAAPEDGNTDKNTQENLSDAKGETAS